ncbi:MAG TPA: Brp/Blh family beta-carotene 15,15'-dioxygenase [Sphingomonas sp.]|nr:Brp/Blh family beta-carotene 15,15'-dioxygenase [Sphingomonas sp.]
MTLADRRVPQGRGEGVSVAFWLAAFGLAFALVARLPLGGPTATLIATLIFIGGGMPHGAYDIALLMRATRLGRGGLTLAVCGYIAIAGVMAALWIAAPLLALVLFIAIASIHFGEDWTMIDEPLLKIAAGTAIIATPAIGHPAEVARLFVAMSGGQGGATIARAMIAVAPVALLVTSVGILVAWRDGAREWAAATGIALIGLLVAPPVAGFALFFVFLHSPRHLTGARTALSGISRRWWIGTGAIMSAAAILGWVVFAAAVGRYLTPDRTAQAFQLLATVAVPHLVFSRWIEKRLASHEPTTATAVSAVAATSLPT